MSSSKGNLFTRDDTFFGVCEGLGQDLGVPSNLLRIGFALALFFNPVVTIATYFGLGALVLATRLAFPARGRMAKEVAVVEAVEVAPAPAADAIEERELLAA